jgi:transcriptional regulator with AAA-type ATPase domain
MLDLEGYNGFKIKSKKMLEVFEAVADFAHHGLPVIMFGPSGAGKEFLARYYYAQYHKITGCSGSFISLNCSQLVRETAHSILFGHVKGSFTDAYQDQKGQFELARQGVLFLDEIGDLDEGLQTMVNRAMDDNTRIANKLGSEKTYSTEDVKVICATERPKERINDALLYRAGLQVHVPGLDERPEDVEDAIKHFCENAIRKRLDYTYLLASLLNRSKNEIDANSLHDPQIVSLIEDLARHLSPMVKARDWPGNFRALRTAIDSGIIRAKKVNSHDDFLEDVKKYFLHHLGDYSISVQDEPVSIQADADAGLRAATGKWLEVLNRRIPDMDDKEKALLDIFLSEIGDLPFKRREFEKHMLLSTRNAQIRIKLLKENKILECVQGQKYKYRATEIINEPGSQDINAPHFMELPEPDDSEFMPEKNSEALAILANSGGLFVSDEDVQKRESFFGTLGNRLKEDHDILFFSFHKGRLQDFINHCIEHLSSLDMEGWFNKREQNKKDLKEQIIGLSGYFTQSLSQHRKTIFILEGIEKFSTGESHALIEQMIYYWYPVQFILGSRKQFFQQNSFKTMDFMELQL